MIGLRSCITAATLVSTPPTAATPTPQADPPVATRAPADATPTSPPAPAVATPPAPAPAPVRSGPPMPPRDERGVGLLTTGSFMFGLTYMFTSLGGAIAIDKATDRPDDEIIGDEDRASHDRQERYGKRLLVPVVGPLLAIRHADSAKAAWAAGFSGVLQVGGAVALVIGGVRYARYRRAKRWQLAAGPTLGGAQLSLSGRF